MKLFFNNQFLQLLSRFSILRFFLGKSHRHEDHDLLAGHLLDLLLETWQ